MLQAVIIGSVYSGSITAFLAIPFRQGAINLLILYAGECDLEREQMTVISEKLFCLMCLSSCNTVGADIKSKRLNKILSESYVLIFVAGVLF